MTRTNRLLLIVLVLLAIVAATLWLDFRVSQQSMAVNSTAQRYALGVDSSSPLPASQSLDLYVLAPAWLAPRLEDRLAEALDDNPYVGQITVRDEPLQAAAGAVLVVSVEEPASAFWTPFYTRTAAKAEFAYALNGEVDWIDVTPVVMSATDPAEADLRVRSTLDLAGSGYGLISRPGYYSYLAAEIAAHINTLLEQQVSGTGL